MPEARDRLPVTRTGAGDLVQGFSIHRGFYVDAAPARNWHARNPSRLLSGNKENIPPESSGSRRRRTRPRKSTLPSWYPRTPLRDITEVVHALERRRVRLREAAERRRRNQDSPDFSLLPSPVSPLGQELSTAEQTPPPIQEQDPSLDISTSSPDLTTVTEKSPLPVDHPIEVSAPINNKATKNPNLIAVEKKCQDLIEQIERCVIENVQKRAKIIPKKKQAQSTLMSMR